MRSLPVHGIDRTDYNLDGGVAFLDSEHGSDIGITVSGHHKCDLEYRKTCQHVRCADVTQVRVIFLVTEGTYTCLILVNHGDTFILFCEFQNDVVTVCPAPENAVF